jgi:predicted dehydrogenase
MRGTEFSIFDFGFSILCGISEARKMTPPPLRWGLIGTGRIARAFAAAVLETETAGLAAVGSRTLETAAAFAREFGNCRAHGSYAALLADPDVEAVYISTPHPMHAEWAIAAARAGKHVLCEKPLAMSGAEAERVVEEAERAGVFLMEAFMYRCHPFLAKLASLVADGVIGEVGLIESTFSYRGNLDPTSRLYSRELGGGGILDVGCYPVSISRLLAGAAAGKAFAEPMEVVGLARLSEELHVDLVANACLRFESGILATLGCGLGLNQESRVRVYGSKGSLHVVRPWHGAPAGEPVTIHVSLDGEQPRTVEITAHRSIYAIEADVVAEAIRAGLRESPRMSWADSLGNMRTLDRWLAAAGMNYR